MSRKRDRNEGVISHLPPPMRMICDSSSASMNDEGDKLPPRLLPPPMRFTSDSSSASMNDQGDILPPKMNILPPEMIYTDDNNIVEGLDAFEVDLAGNTVHEDDKKRRWKHEIHKWAFIVKTATNEDRVKCQWCIDCLNDNKYANEGSRGMQLCSLNAHAKSADHKAAAAIHRHKLKGEKEKAAKDYHVDSAIHAEEAKIVACMKTVYFMVDCDFPLHQFPEFCRFMRYLGTPNIPTADEDSIYTNALEFLRSIRNVLRLSLHEEVCSSPFFSILIHESTARTLEKHLIVYLKYLNKKGKGGPKWSFVRLLRLEILGAEACFDALESLLLDLQLDEEKIIVIATNGASMMMGCLTGVVARFQARNPDIKGVHSIAHREAIGVKDALSSSSSIFVFIDRLANKVYSSLRKSSNLDDEFNNLLEIYDEHHLDVLEIHGIRWLSRVKVMESLVTLMPAILDQWKRHDHELYADATIFQVQFMLHFLADVLLELSKLSKAFEKEMVDATRIGMLLDSLKRMFYRKYLSHDKVFGNGSTHLAHFYNACNDGILSYVDGEGVSHDHILRYVPISYRKWAAEADFLNRNEGVEDSGSLAHCIRIARSFIMVTMDALTNRFADNNDLFQAMNFFNPSSYATNRVRRDLQTETWLHKLIAKFGSKVDMARCLSEREDFVVKLYRVVKNKKMDVAWSICKDEDGSWWRTFPAIMKLWQCCMIIPVSTAVCETGLSKENANKSAGTPRLGLETLDALLAVSLSNETLETIKWSDCFQDWYGAKKKESNSLTS